MIRVLSYIKETSSDPDENSSAIDHSYSPTPDRDDVKDGDNSTGSRPVAKSRKSFLDFFSSRTSFVNEGKSSIVNNKENDLTESSSVDR